MNLASFCLLFSKYCLSIQNCIREGFVPAASFQSLFTDLLPVNLPNPFPNFLRSYHLAGGSLRSSLPGL